MKFLKTRSVMSSWARGSRDMRRLPLVLLLFLLLPTFAYAAVVNINTADAALLDTLPGIGPTKAAAIVDYRESHGPFKHIEDIQEVSGIGPSTFAKLSSQITVSEVKTATPVQPSPPPTRSQEVQVAITSPSASAHAVQTARAPRAATEVAALGAASSTSIVPVVAPPAPTPEPVLPPASGGSFHRTMVFGLLGIVVFAAAAFMIL